MPDIIVIYHNPRCRKSRETLSLIEAKGHKPKVIKYLETPPQPEELRLMLAKLDMNVKDILRKGEPVYKEKYKHATFNDDEWLRILAEEPKLIERPIVVRGSRAILGRPPENVLKLL